MENTTYKFKTREQYLETLDSILPDSYVQTRQHGSGSTKYIPIPIKEAVADDLFFYWNVVDETFDIVNNQILCTVKICYMPSYPGADEYFCTGSAASPLGTAKNSLEYKTPGTRSEAIGCALQTLGNIFGRNTDRKINSNTSLPSNYKIRKHEK